jgi:APA family basic amino acid/polyamine antiporter
VTFIAGEIKNPQKNIGLSLLFGTLIVTFIYVMMNVVCAAKADVCSALPAYSSLLLLVGAAPSLSHPLTFTVTSSHCLPFLSVQ